MTPERLLVMALNMRSPIPNVAAIKSHLPTSVLLLRLDSNDEGGELLLDESEERLMAWANGTLPQLYGFDPDLDFEHAPVSPSTIPDFHVMRIEGLASSSEQIVAAMANLISSQSDEVRVEICAGRKEDSALLSRLPWKLNPDQRDRVSVWYTDVTSGTSVNIGGGTVEREEHPLGQIDRLWLNSSPVMRSRVLRASELRGDLLSTVLDTIERTQRDFAVKGKMASKERDENARRARRQLIEVLDKSYGIQHLSEDGQIRFYRDDPQQGSVDVQKNIFDRMSGFWVESLTALAIAEKWDCESIHLGVSITHHDPEERLGMLKSRLKKPWGGKDLARIWSACREESVLPGEFAGMKFFDLKNFDINEYHPPPRLLKKNPDFNKQDYNFFLHESEIGYFADWIIEDWSHLPQGTRQFLTDKSSTKRDLDLLVETSSHCLFIECKLDPSTGGKIPEANKAKIDSIVSS